MLVPRAFIAASRTADLIWADATLLTWSAASGVSDPVTVTGSLSPSRAVIAADDEVDQKNQILIELLHEMMRENSDYIAPAVHCFSASRHLERIADLAVNISEEVIYLVLGDIVRHQHGEFDSHASE